MKQVLSDSILLIPDTHLLDNKYVFQLPMNISHSCIVDIAELLKEFRNDRVEYKKDYKLWNQVYSTEKELELFQGILDKALRGQKKIHIINCTLREEIQIIREFYEGLGYFNPKENCFIVPFVNAPVTIGINIRNLAYSTKDYKSKRESICFIPPPREPGHTKTLFAGINSGVVSTVSINDIETEASLLREILGTEKISLTKFAQITHGNFLELGCNIEKTKDWIVEFL